MRDGTKSREQFWRNQLTATVEPSKIVRLTQRFAPPHRGSTWSRAGVSLTNAPALPPCPPAPRADRIVDVVGWISGVGAGLGYLFRRFVLSIIAFVLVVAGLSAGVGLLVVGVGIPITAITLWVAQKFGNVDRSGAGKVLGTRIPKAPRLPRGLVGFRALREPWAWRDPAHAILGFPLAVAFFPFAVGWTVGGLGGLLYPLWAWSLPDENTGLASLLLGFQVPVLDAAFVVAAGALVVWSTPFVVRGLAWVDARLAAWMLHDETAALRRRTRELTSSRSAAAEAEAAALTRLERDLHDGPQQRLLRLGMDLDLAQRRMESDPEGAKALVGQATLQVRETLAELRMLSRGVAPPELSENGLPTALTALASRSMVPTTLDVRLPPGRLPPIVERTAYFVVAECLANVGKHSGATACRIEVSDGAGRLQVIVMDDGVGGANLGLGHGLAGLVDRLHGVDGTLDIDSPVGGPTWIRAQLPDA